MKKWLFVIDVEKCENCNNCFLSCKDEHVDNDWPGYAAPQPAEGPAWIRIPGKERGRYPFIDVAYLPTPCMHCDDPPCLKAAHDGAISKRPDGIVLIDPVKAKGQKQLVQACPYGAIQWNEPLDLPQKCTLCAHLLDGGWTKTRCVQSCPTGALGLLAVEEAEAPTIIAAEHLEVYEPGYKTAPRIYYKNLSRFTRCFIGGSVATRTDEGREECAAGALVTLLDAAGAAVGECTTDAFGDFKFDALKENSGRFTLRISYSNRAPVTVEVELRQESLNAGIIFV
jgi:Fe-S-cluster-containing dehydrogenase component